MIDLSSNRQKEDWFLKICLNGRILAIVDRENDDFAVFESGERVLQVLSGEDTTCD